MKPDPGATPSLPYLRLEGGYSFSFRVPRSPHVQALHISRCPLILIPLPQMEAAVPFQHPRAEIPVIIVGSAFLPFSISRG